MNLVFIPFFLGVIVPDEQRMNWSRGPEYSFHVKLSGLFSDDFDGEPLWSTNMTITMTCQPNTVDSLVCRLDDVATDDKIEGPVEEARFETPFEILFNEQGVESLSFSQPYDIEKLNIIRSIAKELNVGTNLKKHADSLPIFLDHEKYVLGECATLFRVSNHEDFDEPESMEDSREGLDYSLSVLPFSAPAKRGSSFVLEKRTEHRRCDSPEDTFYISQGLDFKVGKSVTKIQVTGEHGFKSRTEMQVKVPRTLTGRRDTILQDIVSVELKEIRPAKERLAHARFEASVGLRYTEKMMHNFIV